MLEYAIVEPGSILGVRPSGALSAEDFDGLTRFVDDRLEKHGGFTGLLVESRSFPGWDSFASFVSHVRFIRIHQRSIKRIALVTDSPIAYAAELLANPFVAADIRCFAFGRRDDALRWLRTGRRSAATLTAPKGGHPPLDPASDTPESASDATRRFKTDSAAQALFV